MIKRFIIIISIALLFLDFSSLRAQEDTTINILLIGNSFTARHDLYLLVEEIVKEGKPYLNVNVETATYGGQSLFQHAEYYFTQTFIEESTIDNAEINRRIAVMRDLLELTELPAAFVHFWEDIRGQQVQDFPTGNIEIAIRRHENLLNNNPGTKWDYVVLQTWQDEIPDLSDGYAKYAKYLGNIAREQGAKVIFYMTAPDFQNEVPVTGPVRQEDYEEQIDMMIRLAQEFQPHGVVPVSMAINMIQQGGTELTFRYVNDFHPNQRTAFLTTNMIYDAMFKEPTVGFNFNTVTENNPKGNEPGQDPDGNPATVVFEGEEKLYLQQIADAAVTRFEDIWKRTAVSGVSISNAPASIFLGKDYQLEVRLDPVYASNKEVTWEVLSGDAVTIDENGLITAVAIGTAIVKVTATDGGFSDTCEITVAPVAVSSVQLENCPGDFILTGDTVRLNASVLPEDAADKTVFWTSTNTEVATVDAAGLVTAKSSGIAYVSVTTNDGNYTGKCIIEVQSPVIRVSGVDLTGCASEELHIGDILQLDARFTPSDATDQSVAWSSSDTSVARVNVEGMVTALAEGNATITVITNDGGFVGDCNLRVIDSLSSNGSAHSEFSAKEIKLYPNPANDRVHIEFSDNTIQHSIRVFDHSGKKVYESNTKQPDFIIDLGKHPMEGLLAVYVYNENEVSIFKLIVTR